MNTNTKTTKATEGTTPETQRKAEVERLRMIAERDERVLHMANNEANEPGHDDSVYQWEYVAVQRAGKSRQFYLASKAALDEGRELPDKWEWYQAYVAKAEAKLNELREELRTLRAAGADQSDIWEVRSNMWDFERVVADAKELAVI